MMSWIQALVEGDGGGEAGDEGVDGFTEAAPPGLIGLVSAHEFASIGLKKEGVERLRG